MLKTLDEAERALNKFVPKADSQRAKYTLDRMVKLMDVLGNPQEDLRVIHVAGTSGKTSTCYYTAALLKHAGLKVGLTVSPHIDKITERVQINNLPISDQDFAENLDEFLNLVKQSQLNITYFELLMAFAYWYFAKVGVDVVVIETGLGGLLDASNVVKNPAKFCVITDIGLDHTEVLGTQVGEIAAQKAGIIHKGNQVFMLEQTAEVNDIVKQRCIQVSATLYLLSEQGRWENLPDFQKRNFSLASQVVANWLKQYGDSPLSASQLDAATKIVIPARMEIVKRSGKTIILDGAHNTQKMQAFTDSFTAKFGNQKAAVLLAIKQGKDHESLLEELLPITSKLTLTEFAISQDMPFQAVSSDKIIELCKKKGFHKIEVEPDPKQAFKKLLNSNGPLLVVTGSLYLVATIHQSFPKEILQDY